MDINNLLNPQSVAKVKDITITTLMKYNGDKDYSKIDHVTSATNFISSPGVIDGSKMKVTTETNDLSTYAENQVYILEFTTNHKVFKGGYIQITLPDKFKIGSRSTAMASFEVKSGTKNYCGIFDVDDAKL